MKNITNSEQHVSLSGQDAASIEAAYSFFHQKWRVYAHSTNERQRDDIEYAISSYIEQMSPTLYQALAQGRQDYLVSHATFARDIQDALEQMESVL